MNPTEKKALAWLIAHNSTGIFNKKGVLLAAGEYAPFMRRTWNSLISQNKITIEGKRVCIQSSSPSALSAQLASALSASSPAQP